MYQANQFSFKYISSIQGHKHPNTPFSCIWKFQTIIFDPFYIFSERRGTTVAHADTHECACRCGGWQVLSPHKCLIIRMNLLEGMSDLMQFSLLIRINMKVLFLFRPCCKSNIPHLSPSEHGGLISLFTTLHHFLELIRNLSSITRLSLIANLNTPFSNNNTREDHPNKKTHTQNNNYNYVRKPIVCILSPML